MISGIRRTVGRSLAAAALLVATSATSASAETWQVEPVSPLQSGGLNVWTAWGSASGEAAFFQTDPQDPEIKLAQRTESGWETTLRHQQNPGVFPMFQDATPDMARVVVNDRVATMFGDTIFKEGVYLHDGDQVKTVARWDEYSGRPNPLAKPGYYLGGSEDKKTLFISVQDGDSVGVPTTPTHLYRWVDGTPEPIEIPDQRYQDCPAIAVPAGMRISSSGNVNLRVRSLMQNGISADGMTYVVAPNSCTAGGDQYPTHLYLFREGMAPIDITKPVAGNDAGSTFLGMSQDGTRIFLTSGAQLTEDDTDTTSDIYRWEDDSLTRITADPLVEDLILGTNGAIVAPEANTVWFVARTSTTPFSWGLYAWEDGSVREVTSLNGSVTFKGEDKQNPTQISRDGSTLLVQAAPSSIGTPATGSQQLYRITIEGEVDCISCTASGTAVAGSTMTSEPEIEPKTAWPDPRISADGSTIAFESPAALVPEDTNGKVDVYVWRNGEHQLISTGSDGEAAVAVGLSWDGRTVFFKSWGALLPGATDEYRKFYAARLGGGFPPPPPAGGCGFDCQGSVTPTPSLPVIGSVSFEGDGNASADGAARRATVRTARLRTVRGARARLRVRVSGPGRIVANGPVIRRAARSAARAGSFNVPIVLTRQARQRLMRNGRLAVRAQVVYRARGGGRAVKRFAVTFRLPNVNRAVKRGGR